MRPISIRLALAVFGTMLIGGCAAGNRFRAPRSLPFLGGQQVGRTSTSSEMNGHMPWIDEGSEGFHSPGDSISRVAHDEGYLRYGPAFVGEEVAAQTPRTATERALELKEENARLSAEMAKVKQQVALIRSDLKATNASLEECIVERKALRDELAIARSEMTQWKNELADISELIRERETSHLNALDEMVALIEGLVEQRAAPELTLTDARAQRLKSNLLGPSEAKQ